MNNPLNQKGRLYFEGRKATQFWIRAFQLEADIETVRNMINAKAERTKGTVPIIAEYTADERLKFIFIIQAQVDALGIQDGLGVIYWASPEFEKEVFQVRDRFADEVLREVHKRKFHEILAIESKSEK